MSKSLVEYQRAYLLLQPLGAADRRITRSEANAVLRTAVIRKGLALSVAKAHEIRGVLCEEGYLSRTRDKTEKGGTANFYSATDKGIALLLEMEQYPLEIVIPGRAINVLLAAVNESRTKWAEQEVPVDLRPAIMEEFNALMEEHRRTGLVPIYKVRERIAARFGEEAATHRNLDEQIKQLWREKRFRLITITGFGEATAQQLDASIVAGNQTFFYLEEPAHASTVAG